MTQLWTFSPTIEKWTTIEAMEIAVPPRFEWLNKGILYGLDKQIAAEHPDHEYWEWLSLAFSRMPTPRLRVTDPTLDSNMLFFSRHGIASTRLRQAFGLDERVIRYRPIDMSACVPEVQALGYEMFDVIAYGNPFDPARMPGHVRPVRQPDGSLRDEWVFDYFGTINEPFEIYFRDDFVPPAPLFRSVGGIWTFATDELADRVQRAGLDDIMFLDISGPILPNRGLRTRPKPPG